MSDDAVGPVRPFLKWAGNKSRLVARIKALLPPGKRLLEPFVGSGAVFLNARYARYLLTDSNKDLVALYRLLQSEGREFVEYCRPLFIPGNNLAERYYELRSEFNESDNEWRRSALFVYLNRHGYNGLCRYNAKGGFNVPFGRYARPYFPESEMLAFYAKAKYAEFRHADFRVIMSKARVGDVVYCDPPYVPLSPSANFTSYSAGGFAETQQYELAEMARQLASKGVPVLISNHNTDLTRRIYAGARTQNFGVQRFISCDGNRRGKASELLALFAPEKPLPEKKKRSKAAEEKL